MESWRATCKYKLWRPGPGKQSEFSDDEGGEDFRTFSHSQTRALAAGIGIKKIPRITRDRDVRTESRVEQQSPYDGNFRLQEWRSNSLQRNSSNFYNFIGIWLL